MSVWNNAWIGGIYSVYIGVNFTDIGMEFSSKSNRCCVRAAAAKSCDIFILIDSLESGYDDDLVRIKLFTDTLGINSLESCILII